MSHGLDVVGGRGGEAGRAALHKQRDAHDRADVGRPEYPSVRPGRMLLSWRRSSD